MKFAFRAFADGKSQMFEYDIEFVDNRCYRPNRLIVNGEEASMDRFAEKHGYNWRSSANDNTLCYATESGKEYWFSQKKLLDFGKKHGIPELAEENRG